MQVETGVACEASRNWEIEAGVDELVASPGNNLVSFLPRMQLCPHTSLAAPGRGFLPPQGSAVESASAPRRTWLSRGGVAVTYRAAR